MRRFHIISTHCAMHKRQNAYEIDAYIKEAIRSSVCSYRSHIRLLRTARSLIHSEALEKEIYVCVPIDFIKFQTTVQQCALYLTCFGFF